MILAASNIGWTSAEDKLAINTLCKVGIDAIEVAPSRIFSDPATATIKDAEVIRSAWCNEKLPIVSMQSLLYRQNKLTVFGDSADKKAFIKYISQVIILAGALGAGPLVFGSPKNRLKGEMSFKQAKAKAIPLFREIGDLCGKAETCFCIEANAQAYGCDFMTTIREVADVVVAVDHPHVSVVADTGNMLMAGDSLDDFASVCETVSHIHISAPQLAPITNEEFFLSNMATKLLECKYDGVVTLEMRAVDDRLASLTESAALMARIFKSIKK